MFIIAGTKGKTTTAGRGEFYCPQCQTNTHYLHQQVHKKATVFFVSVANLKLLGEYIECQSCNGTYPMGILDYDAEKQQQEFESLYRKGIKKVMILMMMADGKVEESEIVMMEDIYRKVTGEELLDDELEKEIKFCMESPLHIKEFLDDLFPYLNDHGKEMIIKASYYVAIADDTYSEDEETFLKNIGKILQLSPAHLKGIIAEIHE